MAVKGLVRAVIALAMVLAGCSSPEGSASGPMTLQVTVPFAFYAGESKLPAGRYLATPAGTEALLLAPATGNGRTRVAVTQWLSANHGHPACGLVFHRYGDDSLLSEIWFGPEGGQVAFKKLPPQFDVAAPRERLMVAGAILNQARQ